MAFRSLTPVVRRPLGGMPALVASQRFILSPKHFEPPLDKQIGDRSKKGPPTAHELPIYKQAHKLQSSARWKTANLITNVTRGKDFRLRETHGEGRVDDSGMYRDWLYGEERRFANYLCGAMAFTSMSLFYYTVKLMGSESWDIPAPMLAKPPEIATRTPMPTVASRTQLIKKDAVEKVKAGIQNAPLKIDEVSSGAKGGVGAF